MNSSALSHPQMTTYKALSGFRTVVVGLSPVLVSDLIYSEEIPTSNMTQSVAIKVILILYQRAFNSQSPQGKPSRPRRTPRRITSSSRTRTWWIVNSVSRRPVIIYNRVNLFAKKKICGQPKARIILVKLATSIYKQGRNTWLNKWALNWATLCLKIKLLDGLWT